VVVGIVVDIVEMVEMVVAVVVVAVDVVDDFVVGLAVVYFFTDNWNFLR